MQRITGNELFNSYESDLQNILASVKDNLHGEATQGRTEQRKGVLRRLEMDLDEAGEAVRLTCCALRLCSWRLFAVGQVAQMEIEVQSLDRAVKSKAQVKLRGYKAELASRHSELVRLLPLLPWII